MCNLTVPQAAAQRPIEMIQINREGRLPVFRFRFTQIENTPVATLARGILGPSPKRRREENGSDPLEAAAPFSSLQLRRDLESSSSGASRNNEPLRTESTRPSPLPLLDDMAPPRELTRIIPLPEKNDSPLSASGPSNPSPQQNGESWLSALELAAFDIENYNPPSREELNQFIYSINEERSLPEVREQAQNALRNYNLYKILLDTFDIENYRPLSDQSLNDLKRVIKQSSVAPDTLTEALEALRNHAIYKELLANFDLKAHKRLSTEEVLALNEVAQKREGQAEEAKRKLRDHEVYIALLEHYAQYGLPSRYAVTHAKKVLENAQHEKKESVKHANYILKHDALRFDLSKWIAEQQLSGLHNETTLYR